MSKCFAYVVYWDLLDEKHWLLLPEEVPGGETKSGCTVGPMSLTYGDHLDTKHKLEIVSPWIGRRTLGVWITPAGTLKAKLQYRWAQSRELALRIAGSELPRETACIGHHIMVRLKLEYPLAVT
jgi:hypothetical protein